MRAAGAGAQGAWPPSPVPAQVAGAGARATLSQERPSQGRDARGARKAACRTLPRPGGSGGPGSVSKGSGSGEQDFLHIQTFSAHES